MNLVRKVNDGKGTARFLRDLDSNRPGPWTDKPRSMSLSASGSRPPVLGPLRPVVEHVLVENGHKADLSSLLGPQRNDVTISQPEIHENPGAEPLEQDSADLLASPIALDRQNLDMDRVREVVQEALRNGEGEKRGSGLVMADELDRLEQSESALVVM